MLQTLWSSPAQAQSRDDDYTFHRGPRRSSGFFQDLFAPIQPRREYHRRYRRAPRVHRARRADHSHAPPPRKAEKGAPPPTTAIVVMGDSMADWLAYGLEQAFSNTPKVGIVRKYKRHSGLIRYQAKSGLYWWHQARDILSKQNASYVVMILGLNDRKNIRERDLVKEAEKQQAEKEAAENKKDETNSKKNAAKNKKKGTVKMKTADAAKPKLSNRIIKFRSARWAAVYTKRIEKTIAALKSKHVPVFWVGLPSIRGTKSTANALYLNRLFRARAENAGIVYIDVWDGFIDDAGKYSSYGPDYEGQTRRLRTSDGVFFTKYGARKLAHYVERQIRRYMRNRSLQATLSTGPVNVPKSGKSTAHPIAGPVIPLTAITSGVTDRLLGAGDIRPSHGDSIATRALVNGKPVARKPGRADDFSWPPGSAADISKPPASDESKTAADEQSSLAPAATN